MLSEILQRFSKLGAFPYDDWEVNPESHLLLQQVWLEVLSDAGVFAGARPGCPVHAIPGSPSLSIRKGRKSLSIYTIASDNQHQNFDFYIKAPIDDKDMPVEDQSVLVIDSKIDAGLMAVVVNLAQQFEKSKIESTSERDAFYRAMHARYGNLLPYYIGS